VLKSSTKGLDVRSKTQHLTLEVCIDTPEAVAVCAAGGTDRIELCSALALGGLTQSPGLMALAARSDIPVHTMIRPIDGGFIVCPDTLVVMFGDIAAARAFGLAGGVLGATTPEHRLDIAKMEKFVAAAGPMEVTLHLCNNQFMVVIFAPY
jgi:copper homeostasis protein